MSRVSTALAFLGCKVGLGCDRIDPAADHVGGDGVVHEEVRHTSTISVFSDMHMDLVSQDLVEETLCQIIYEFINKQVT